MSESPTAAPEQAGAATARPDRLQPLWDVLVIIWAVLVAYWPAIHGSIVMDDTDHLTAPAL